LNERLVGVLGIREPGSGGVVHGSVLEGIWALEVEDDETGEIFIGPVHVLVKISVK
jgi:hypothetical protein